jgi:hypothetical protein
MRTHFEMSENLSSRLDRSLDDTTNCGTAARPHRVSTLPQRHSNSTGSTPHMVFYAQVRILSFVLFFGFPAFSYRALLYLVHTSSLSRCSYISLPTMIASTQLDGIALVVGVRPILHLFIEPLMSPHSPEEVSAKKPPSPSPRLVPKSLCLQT